MEIRMLNICFTTLICIQIIPDASGQCPTTQFECDNGSCIDLDKLCDFTDDCGDGSDEKRHVTGFKCPMGRKRHVCVLPQRYVNDSTSQCVDASDVCVADGIDRCHRCVTSDITLAASQVCDGVIDCPDTSDECLCETTLAQPLCDRLLPGRLLACDNSTRVISLDEVCNGKLECGDFTDEMFCGKFGDKKLTRCPGNSSNPPFARLCDGRPECSDYSDECGSCSEQAVCSILNVTSCPLNGSRNVIASDVCDGILEENCFYSANADEQNCSSRFACLVGGGSFVSVDLSLVCNGIADCDDGSDELDCENRFYCETRRSSSPISVPLSFVMDGRSDCADGSDECPAFLDEKLYSSRHHLSSVIAITVWLWIMAIVGGVGNVAVFYYTARRLLRGNFSTPVARVNSVLVLNLNVADLLTSIYLLFIGGKAIEYSGIYCHVDLAWRTSFACNFVGALSIFSAEASLFTLVLLTTQRLYSVYNPFRNTSIGKCCLAAGIASVWLFAAVIAIVPFLLPEVFVERYWIESRYFNDALVRLPRFHDFFRKLIYITEQENTSALAPNFDFRSHLRNNHPNHAILGDFSYYSENSVCVPHFYVPLEDNGSFYPTLIVILNMVAFTYVGIAYYIVYKLSTKNKVNRNHNSNAQRMQRRIAKLVTVNFVVWFPICVASFVQLGIKQEFSDTLFVVTAVFLFPINSVLNPLLYSDVFEKAFARVKRICQSPVPPQTPELVTARQKTTDTNL